MAAVFALAGCGDPKGPKVATAQHPTAVASGGASASVPAKGSDYDKALRYTRCMTEHGAVTADPVEGKALITYNIMHVGETQATMQTRSDAHEKCKQFLPAAWPIKEDPKDIARARGFVECMRRRGQPEPEPDANGIKLEPTDITWRDTPEYDVAFAACRHLVDDPANNQ